MSQDHLQSHNHMTQKEMYQPIQPDRALIVISKETQQNWENRRVYYPKLESLIKTFGVWEVNCNALSREWDVPRSTLYRWKNEIFDSLAITDIRETLQNLKLTSISNIKYLQALIRNPKIKDYRVKVVAIKVQAEVSKNFIELLDRMGISASENKKQTLSEAYLEYEEKHGK